MKGDQGGGMSGFNNFLSSAGSWVLTASFALGVPAFLFGWHWAFMVPLLVIALGWLAGIILSLLLAVLMYAWMALAGLFGAAKQFREPEVLEDGRRVLDLEKLRDNLGLFVAGLAAVLFFLFIAFSDSAGERF